MRATKIVMLLVGAVLLGACTAAVPRNKAYEEGDHARFDDTGTASITGTVLITDGGTASEDLVLGKASRVTLTPLTDYTREWYEREVVAGEKLEDEDPRLERIRRTTHTDMRGRFRFRDLPAGEYILTSTVRDEGDSWMFSESPEQHLEVPVRALVRVAGGESKGDVLVMSH